MADVTFKRIDEMETLYHGVARRARAELGVTGWGMQVYEFPPNWDGHPNHAHDDRTEEAGQEEVYIPLAGSATLVAAQGGDEHAFVQLTSPHRRALHVHAYRMLGNLHDADDALQETLLRAWRGLHATSHARS